MTTIEVLLACALRFREYERGHTMRAEEADRVAEQNVLFHKASRNREMAEMCEDAIEAERVAAAERYCFGLITEEAGEVLQLLGKALRFGTDTPGRLDANGDLTGDTPRTLLPTELGDLRAAIRFAEKHRIVDHLPVLRREHEKLFKLCNPESLDNLGRPLAPQPEA